MPESPRLQQDDHEKAVIVARKVRIDRGRSATRHSMDAIKNLLDSQVFDSSALWPMPSPPGV